MCKCLKMALAALALASLAGASHAESSIFFRYKGVLVDQASGGNPQNPDGGDATNPGGGTTDPDDGNGTADEGPDNEDLDYVLKTATLPGTDGFSEWSYDFSSLIEPAPINMGKVGWRIESHPGESVPWGVSLGQGGVMSGTPRTWGQFSFTVVATINDKDFKQTYSLSVTQIPTLVKSLVKGNSRYMLMEDGSVWYDNGVTATRFAALQSGVERLYGGIDHWCAVKTDGTVWCWGNNTYGQIGDGTTTTRNPPVQIQLDGYVESMALGYYNTCAILNGGHVKCWGQNYYGQVGNGRAAIEKITLPTDLWYSNPLLSGELNAFKKIEIGAAHTCGLTITGNVWCWGSTSYGLMGYDATYSSQSHPDPIGIGNLSIGPIKDIALGAYHTCLLADTGDVFCMGDGQSGQVGNGSYTGINPTPSKVAGVDHAVSINATTSHTCALLEDGSTKCWGAGIYGELGNFDEEGTSTKANSANAVVAMSGKSDFIEVRPMNNYTCALDAERKVTCWGLGYYPFEETQRPWENSGSQ